MKIAVVGSRTFNNYDYLEQRLKKYNISLLISGGANGTDKLAEKYANKYNIEVDIIRPRWEELGKKAGIIRNKQIVVKSDYVLLFWDGISKGTKSTLSFCRVLAKPYTLFYIREEKKEK